MVAINTINSKVGVEKSRGLKKGPWTTAEDAILMEYVKKHGEGNWNAVQRNCGLLRCGKSCRLRWANHLRPNLKKGSFTPDEERLIIELHAKIGNKWARMASQLPGRTDNEIKNYWNTRVKRLHRAGLPIYPDDVPYSYQNNHTFQQTSPNSPISPPLHSSQFNTSISLINPILHLPRMINPPFRFTGHLPMPLTNSISPFATPPRSSLYSQSFRMGSQFSPFGVFNAPGKVELSSIQTWMTNMEPSMPALSTTSGSGSHKVIREQEEGCFKSEAFEEGNNSGLLEVLLEESNTLAIAQNMKKNDSFCDGKAKEVSEEEDSNGDDQPISSPFDSSCGMKEDPMEEMNQLDNDLSSLLDNFPLSSTVPDWYEETATTDVDTDHKEQSSRPVIENRASTNSNWSMGSCCWNNMPSIC